MIGNVVNIFVAAT